MVDRSIQTASRSGNFPSNPRRIGSAARGAAAVAILLGLTACGGGSDDSPAPVAAAPATGTPVAGTPAAPAPTPAAGATPAPAAGTPVPGTPVAGTPTTPAGTPAAPAAGAAKAPVNGQWTADAKNTNAAQAVFFYDANGNAMRDPTERFVVQNLATGHYYELVTSTGPVLFAKALALSTAAGGHLFTADGGHAELQFVRTAMSVPSGSAQTGLGITTNDPTQGAWVGLRNPGALTDAAAAAASPNTGWKWISATAGGADTDFTPASNAWADWIVHPATPTSPNGSREPNGNPYAAMTGGNTLAGGETQCLFNMVDTLDATYAIRKYLIEYENGTAILATPPATN